MTQPDPIVLDLDPSQYTQGLDQASAATTGFTSTLRGVTAATTPVQRAMDLITPPRAALAGLTALAAAAGDVQQQMSVMAASAKVTHANIGVLSAGMRQLARDIPMGNAGARDLTIQLTRLGVATQGSERNVGALSKTFARLGGATGEGPAGLAAGFIQLNRSMNTGFGAERMTKLADSLTTVSAQSGASATGILQFSKAIAPLAQASGIGETKVLGISAAFSKLGDDGLGAATAFNKMLGDMNKSVREGSPDMATYAAIVGKTTAQFQGLFKANPAEAITQVTEAIAKAGPRGQHELEQLGLDGVRTQRYLQELSSSGGLRQTIAQSQEGYGSGNTKKAADAAFSTAQASATRLGAITQQLVDAMGTPLLGAVTKFTDLLGASVSPLAKAAGSAPMQDLIKGAVYTAIPLLVGSKLIGSGGSAALGYQAVTSGPVRAVLAGIARGRHGDQYEGGRFTRGFLGRVDSGEALATTQGLNEFNQRVFANARGLGSLLPASGGTGPGIAAMLRNTAGAGVGGILRLQAEQLRMARTGFSERSMQYAPYGAPYRDFASMRHNIGEALAGGHIQPEEAADLRRFNREQLVGRAGGQGFWRGAGQLGLGLGANAYEGARFGMHLGGRLVGSTLGALGPLGIGVAGYEAFSAMRGNTAQAKETAAGATSFIDDYRVAMGKATDATQTFAGRMQATADSMAASVTTMSAALKIDPNRIMAATYVKKPVMTFAGNAAGVAAQLRLQNTASPIAPDEMARISMDLINQYGAGPAQSILSQVGQGSSDQLGDVRTAVHGFNQAKRAGGWRGWARNLGLSTPGSGGGNSAMGTITTLSGTTQAGVNSLGADLVAQRAKDESLGGDYANKQVTDRMNAAVGQAIKDHNGSLVNALVQSFQQQFDSGQGGFHDKISISDIQKAGGFTQAQAARSKAFRSNLAYANGGAAVLGTDFNVQMAAGTGGESLFSQPAATSDTFVGRPDGFGRARASLANYMTTGVASPAAQTSAVSEAIRAYTNSGQSLEHVADVAGQLAQRFTDMTGPANQFAVALAGAAMSAMQARPQVLTQGQGASNVAGRYASWARLTGDSAKGLRDQGVAGLQGVEEQTKAAIVNRLTVQREFQVTSRRNEEDYLKQREYALFDYHRDVSRAEQSFNLQLSRSNRDYQRQVLHQEQDYQRQRRDMIEDASRQAYSAYQRMQVQPTWDAANLLGNITEQSQALQAQIDNMARLRHAGVNSNAIKLLGLNDPSNAQQLASLVGDLANDPRVAQALNSAASTRQKLGERLTQDPANISLSRGAREQQISVARAKQQYDTVIGDMRQNQRIMLTQMAENYATNTSRMAEANTRLIKRAGEDLARADQEIVGSLDKLGAALKSALNHHYVDFSSFTQSSMATWTTLAKKFSTDWKDLVQGLGYTVTVTPKSGPTPDKGAGSQAGAQPSGPYVGVGVAPNNSDQSGGHFYPNTKMGPAPKHHALGGILSRATMLGSYDVAGEAGPEAVIPLDSRGAGVLAEAMHTFVTRDQARLMSTSAATTYITYDSSTHYTDSGVNVEKIEVHGLSMDEAIAQSRDIAARRNMTRPPQVKA